MPVWQYSEKVAKESIRSSESAQLLLLLWLKWNVFKCRCRMIWRGWWLLVIRAFRTSNFISPILNLYFSDGLKQSSVETTNQFIFTCAHKSTFQLFCLLSAPGSRWKIASDRSWYGGATTKSTISGGLGICFVFIRVLYLWDVFVWGDGSELLEMGLISWFPWSWKDTTFNLQMFYIPDQNPAFF